MHPSLHPLSEYKWEVPPSRRMTVPGTLFLTERLYRAGFDEKALEQIVNAASLPGRTGAAVGGGQSRIRRSTSAAAGMLQSAAQRARVSGMEIRFDLGAQFIGLARRKGLGGQNVHPKLEEEAALLDTRVRFASRDTVAGPLVHRRA